MAEVGDTITYTHDGDTNDSGRYIPESEDISSIDTATVDYCHSTGGNSDQSNGGSGGAAENVVIDISSHDTLYIWVSSNKFGRYRGSTTIVFGGGSAEISFSNTNSADSSDEPFLVGAGGGGSGYGEFTPPFGSTQSGSDGGGRGGSGVGDGGDGEGIAPPLGGDGAPDDTTTGGDGDGAVDDQNRGYIVDGGTTIKGGGSPAGTDGEVKITYGPTAPSSPTNVQITDTATEDELTLDWDAVADATSYNVYRAQSSGSSKSDYTLVAEPTNPPYTDTGLEDGEQYFYRVTSEN